MSKLNERQTYPNILSYTDHFHLESELKSEKCGRRLNSAMVRKLSADQAKIPGKPIFYCEHCHTYFILTYGIFAYDSDLPVFKRAPQFYCRDAVNKKQTRYVRVK